jgi:hypothetical protein
LTSCLKRLHCVFFPRLTDHHFAGHPGRFVRRAYVFVCSRNCEGMSKALARLYEVGIKRLAPRGFATSAGLIASEGSLVA